MTLPAISRSFQSKVKATARVKVYTRFVKPINHVWDSIPKNFRDRYTFTGIFFAVILVVLLIVILAGPAKP